jgi:hypothetical protein
MSLEKLGLSAEKMLIVKQKMQLYGTAYVYAPPPPGWGLGHPVKKRCSHHSSARSFACCDNWADGFGFEV